MTTALTEFVRTGSPGGPLSSAAIADLTATLAETLARRGRPESALEWAGESVAAAVVAPWPALRARVESGLVVDPLVAAAADRFLLDRLRAGDPAGYAAFGNTIAAVDRLLDEGELTRSDPGRLGWASIVRRADPQATRAESLTLRHGLARSSGRPALARLTATAQDWLVDWLSEVGPREFRVGDLAAAVTELARGEPVEPIPVAEVVACGGRGHRPSDGPVRPGQVCAIAHADDPGLFWLVVRGHPERPGAWFVVPADLRGLPGPPDLSLSADGSWPALTVRCGEGVWLPEGRLRAAVRAWEYGDGVISAVRMHLAALALGQLVPDAARRAAEVDPESTDWADRVEAYRRRFQEWADDSPA